MSKRIWAWVGLAYMAIFLGLNFYSMYTGNMITGIAALMFCPVVVGFAVGLVNRYRNQTSQLPFPGVVLLVILSAAMLGYCLYVGIPALMRNF